MRVVLVLLLASLLGFFGYCALNKLNWFHRHLNWAVIIVTFVMGFIVGFVGGFILTLIDPNIVDEEVQGVSLFILWITQFPVFGWMLVQKGRRLWNLLWLIIPIGWLILLCKKNRSQISGAQTSESQAK